MHARTTCLSLRSGVLNRPQAAAKIDAELAPGAVVVDYTGALVSRLARGSLLVVEAVATSWGEVSMHVCVMGPEQ